MRALLCLLLACSGIQIASAQVRVSSSGAAPPSIYTFYGTNDATGSLNASNVVSFILPGGAITTNRVITIDAWGYLDNGTGSSTNLTLSLKYNATTLWGHVVSVAASGAQRPWFLRAQLHMGLDSSHEMVSGVFEADGSGPGSVAGIGVIGSSVVYCGVVFGYGAENSLNPNPFQLIAQWASQSSTCDFAVLGVNVQ